MEFILFLQEGEIRKKSITGGCQSCRVCEGALVLNTPSDRKPAPVTRTSAARGTWSCTGSGPLSGLRGAWQGQVAWERAATGRRKGRRSRRFFSEPLPPAVGQGVTCPRKKPSQTPLFRKTPRGQACRAGLGEGPWLREATSGYWLSSKGGRHGPGCRGGRAGRASPWPLNTASPACPWTGQCHAGPRGRERGSRLEAPMLPGRPQGRHGGQCCRTPASPPRPGPAGQTHLLRRL